MNGISSGWSRSTWLTCSILSGLTFVSILWNSWGVFIILIRSQNELMFSVLVESCEQIINTKDWRGSSPVLLIHLTTLLLLLLLQLVGVFFFKKHNLQWVCSLKRPVKIKDGLPQCLATWTVTARHQQCSSVWILLCNLYMNKKGQREKILSVFFCFFPLFSAEIQRKRQLNWCFFSKAAGHRVALHQPPAKPP